MSEKSTERLELEQEAASLGISFKHNISDEKLLERIAAAEGEASAPQVSPLEVLHNKLEAYGVPREQHKTTVAEAELQLTRVLAARAKAAEKRKQKDEGDYYGKTATVRITKMGDDKVGTGEYIAGIGNLCYAVGETPELPLTSAKSLEARGLVEIQNG